MLIFSKRCVVNGDSIRSTITIITYRQIYTHAKYSNFTLFTIDDKTLADGVSIRRTRNSIHAQQAREKKKKEEEEC
jgi:hypothetical protein